MQPFQQRVVDEERDLVDKLEKLTAFIDGNGLFKNLSVSEQSRMQRQLVAMASYAAVLKERIAAFT